jgi:integrase
MTADRPPWKFLHLVRDGKTSGRTWYYFRSKETGHIRLGDDPTSGAFMHAYGDALQLRERLRAGQAATDEDSLTWLIDRYLKSAEFAALADSTQLDYSRTCDLLKIELGGEPFRYITRSMVKAVRDDLADTSRKANKVAAVVSLIYSWANQADLVPDGVNPAAGLKKLKRKGGVREIVPWSDPELAWATSAAPLHVLTPLLIALYTGQRREDVVGMTWQQDQGDILRVRTSKTRALIDLPCHPVLRAHLDQVRRGAKVVSLAGPICLTQAGKPFATANALSGALRRFVEAHPRIPNNRSMHGLRYAAAARMEEGGATVAAIEAVLGHRTFRMALKYASARRRAAQGVAAMKGREA